MYADLGSGEPTASINPNLFNPAAVFYLQLVFFSDLQGVDGIRVNKSSSYLIVCISK